MVRVRRSGTEEELDQPAATGAISIARSDDDGLGFKRLTGIESEPIQTRCPFFEVCFIFYFVLPASICNFSLADDCAAARRAEAGLAAARMGLRTALLTINCDTVGQMSCNPAIGGVAKGQIVREIDALGGAMGLITDATAIQFRLLNRGKGPAMHSPRPSATRRRTSSWPS